MTKLLVTYATKYGSTREVAEAVAAEMRQKGADVELRECGEVNGVAEYDGLVLGCPLYIGSMLKDARNFLDRNQDDITSTPTALFFLGPLRATDDMDEARGQIDGALKKEPWFAPIETGMFVGAYDPRRLTFLDKLAAVPPASPLHGLAASDDRDWTAIRDWGASTADKLMAAIGAE